MKILLSGLNFLLSALSPEDLKIPMTKVLKIWLFSNFRKLNYPTILFSIVDDKRFFVETGA
jgi:hypothetical protein